MLYGKCTQSTPTKSLLHKALTPPTAARVKLQRQVLRARSRCASLRVKMQQHARHQNKRLITILNGDARL